MEDRKYKQTVINIINDALIWEEAGDAIALITGEFPSKRCYHGLRTACMLMGIDVDSDGLWEELNEIFTLHLPLVKNYEYDLTELSSLIYNAFIGKIVTFLAK